MTPSALVFALLGIAAPPSPSDALLDKLTGSWTITGTIEGEPVEQTLDVRWTLAHRFIELHFLGARPMGAGEPPYEARVFVGVDAKTQRYVAYWLDVFGATASVQGAGVRDGDTLVLTFPYPKEEFRNTYTFLPDGTCRLLIESRPRGGAVWKTFASETLTHARP